MVATDAQVLALVLAEDAIHLAWTVRRRLHLLSLMTFVYQSYWGIGDYRWSQMP